MNNTTRGPRDRRRPDVLAALARARPASLDQDPAGIPAAEAAARFAALAAASPPGDRTARPPARVARGRRIPQGLLAGTGLALAAGATAAVLVATSGTAVPPSGTHPPAPRIVTAAVMRQLASATRIALARSGGALISYTDTRNGVRQDAGSDTITFSGHNWNDVIGQSFPSALAPRDQPINRIVNGQFYLFISGQTKRLRWYHDTNSTGQPSFSIPDPRTVLRELEPSARFVTAGHQMAGGVRLTELRATDVSQLPVLRSLPELSPKGRLTSLTVWVDGHGVVHRMSLASQVVSTTYPIEKARDGAEIITVPDKAMAAAFKNKLKQAPGRQHFRIVVASPSSAKQRQVDVTALSVSFFGIGQPQRITAPRHAINVYGQG